MVFGNVHAVLSMPVLTFYVRNRLIQLFFGMVSFIFKKKKTINILFLVGRLYILLFHDLFDLTYFFNSSFLYFNVVYKDGELFHNTQKKKEIKTMDFFMQATFTV